jgi:hypothetical protein
MGLFYLAPLRAIEHALSAEREYSTKDGQIFTATKTRTMPSDAQLIVTANSAKRRKSESRAQGNSRAPENARGQLVVTARLHRYFSFMDEQQKSEAGKNGQRTVWFRHESATDACGHSYVRVRVPN